MSNFPILDLVVGIIFVFFLLSIICSSIVEMLLTFYQVRAEFLGKWLMSVFNTPIREEGGQKVLLGQDILDHCSLTGLTEKAKRLRTLIPRTLWLRCWTKSHCTPK